MAAFPTSTQLLVVNIGYQYEVSLSRAPNLQWRPRVALAIATAKKHYD